MRAALAAVLLLSLAGCSSPPQAPQDAMPSASMSSSSAPVVAQPTVEVVGISFDGNLGTSAHGCVFPAGVCHTGEVVADETDVVIERPGTNLTGLPGSPWP